MKYRVQFQYRPKDSARPLDYGQAFDVTGGDRDGGADEFLLLPNVGDHVDLPDEGDEKGDFGKVENRLFCYQRLGDEMLCLINIVITDSDVGFDKLMKS